MQLSVFIIVESLKFENLLIIKGVRKKSFSDCGAVNPWKIKAFWGNTEQERKTKE